MSSNHSDWLGHNRIHGRVSSKRAAVQAQAIRKREEDREAREARRERQREHEEDQRRKVRESKRGMIGRLAGAVRRIFSRGKV